MGKFRDNMKWIMLVTAITFVGLMVFGWGMDITGRSSTGGGDLGKVNGEPITQQEYNLAYRNLYQQQQKSAPGQQIGAAMNRQIEQSAWDQLVMQKLINQELKRRGIEVTESEIRQAARYAPPPEFAENDLFKTNGQFDINKYHQFLASPSVDATLLLQLEAYYRDVIPRSKLFYQVTSGTYMPESQLWRIWRDAKETATVRYIAIDPETMIPDASASVSDREIQKYYKEHEKDFARPATAKVKYVVIDRSPNAADSASALARANTAREAAMKDFAEAAKTSADSGSAKQGGSLGTFHKGQMVPQFDQAVWSQPLNTVGAPVLTQFGYHIIKVTARTDSTATASHILIPIERSDESDNRLLDRADSLESLGQDKKIEEAAQQMGLRVREGELNDSTPFLTAVGAADDAAQWIFRDGEVGENSEVFETPTLFYMVQIVSKRDAGLVPLEEAKTYITQKLRQQKKIDMAKEKARTILEQAKSSGLDAAAATNKLRVDQAGPFTRMEMVPGLGRSNAAIGTAFGLKKGEVSNVVEAEGMLFILQLVDKKEADRAEFDAQKTTARARMTQALAEQRWNEFMVALKESAKIIDKRLELQRRASEAATTN